jgi:hypothetical protein
MPILSPNMSLPVPIVGVDTGLVWEQSLAAAELILDAHNHAPGSGVQINPNGININSDLPFNGNNATLLRSTRYQVQASALSGAADLGCTYVSGADLWYNDTAGNQVKITSGGMVNATSSGISSGTATASFVSSVLVVNQATNTPANIQVGSVFIGNNTAGSNFVELSAPSALAASYQIAFPAALPGSTLLMQLTSAGNIITSNTVTGGITLGSGGAQLTSSGTNLVTQTGVYPSTTANASIQATTANTVTITDPSSTTAYPILVSQQPSLAGLMVVRGSFSASIGLSSGFNFATSATKTGGEGFSVAVSSGNVIVTFTAGLFFDIPIVTFGQGAFGFGSFDGGQPVLAATPTAAHFIAQFYNYNGSGTGTANVEFIAIGQRNG